MDEFFAELDEQIEQFGGSWTAYIIRALWHHKHGLGRQDVIDAILEDALNRGRTTPATFADVLQSTFQKHNRNSAVFRGADCDDIFQFVGGKGSGVWAVHRAKALAWMAANGRSGDFIIGDRK